MRLTTLCYIICGDKVLMMNRNKKENDPNSGKWIGVGGGFEAGESPEDCLTREVAEETGLTLTGYRFRGLVTFVSDTWETEYMHLFTADRFSGNLHQCGEGTTEWVEKEKIPSLPLWAGDRIFLKLLSERDSFFSLKLVYAGDTLTRAVLDGTTVLTAQ